MIYTADIVTLITDTVTSPKRTVLDVGKGLVYKVELEFPPGPIGLLFVAIYDGGYQVWPSTPGVWFHSDNAIISFDDTYLKLAAPYTFDIVSYNTDDSYNHWCQVRIGLVSEEIFMARFLPTYTYEYFLKMITKLAEQQEVARRETLARPFPWLMEGEQ